MENQNVPLQPVNIEAPSLEKPKNFYQRLSAKQRKSIIVIILIAIFLPIVTAVSLLATRINSKAFLPGSIVTPIPTRTPRTSPTVGTIHGNPTPPPISTPSVITPTTVGNVSPQITTTSLPMAFAGKPYSATMDATDANITDVLSLTATGLPTGLTLGSCASITNSGQITCTITGTATVIKSYNVLITATDNQGGSISKYFPLSVVVIPVQSGPGGIEVV